MTPFQALLIWAVLATMAALWFWDQADELNKTLVDCEQDCDELRAELAASKLVIATKLDAEPPIPPNHPRAA